MALDDRLDLYEVKAQFERFTEWLDLARSSPTWGSCGGRDERCCPCR